MFRVSTKMTLWKARYGTMQLCRLWWNQCCGSGSVSQRYRYRSRSFHHQENIVRKLFCDFLSLKNDAMYLASWRSLGKIAGSGSGIERYGSADPNQYQNVTDPQQWIKQFSTSGYRIYRIRLGERNSKNSTMMDKELTQSRRNFDLIYNKSYNTRQCSGSVTDPYDPGSQHWKKQTNKKILNLLLRLRKRCPLSGELTLKHSFDL